jgi:hypothetical protein
VAKSILDIVIKTVKDGKGDVETVKALQNIKSTIVGTAAVVGTFVAAGYAVDKVLSETVGTLVNYANQVRRVEDATGASAEDSSKLIQILDDQKISYEQLEKAVAKSGKTYDFSIKGLANMSDQYLKLTDANQQAAFMQERFGKQWISFVPVMKQGKQAILDAADAVNDSLVLTQKAVDDARRYEVAMDGWNDSVMALKISIGQGLLPVLTDLVNMTASHSEAMDRARAMGATYHTVGTLQYQIAMKQVMAEKEAAAATLLHKDATETDTSATEDATQAAKDQEKALKAVSEAHQNMLGTIGKVASAEKDYMDTAASLNDEQMKLEQEKADAINAGWWESSQKVKDYDAALEENAQKIEENADKHHEALGKIQYDLLITKLSADGLTDSEYQIAQQAGLMFGVFDQKSVDTAANLDAITQAVSDGVIQVGDMKKALDMIPKYKTIDVVLNVIAKMAAANAFLSGAHTTTTKQSQQGGYASGGVSSGPDSGHWELLHGTEAVIPLKDGSVPVQMQGPAPSVAGGDVYVTLTIASPMTIMDQQNAQNVLLPFIINGIRAAKAQGTIK